MNQNKNDLMPRLQCQDRETGLVRSASTDSDYCNREQEFKVIGIHEATWRLLLFGKAQADQQEKNSIGWMQRMKWNERLYRSNGIAEAEERCEWYKRSDE